MGLTLSDSLKAIQVWSGAVARRSTASAHSVKVPGLDKVTLHQPLRSTSLVCRSLVNRASRCFIDPLVEGGTLQAAHATSIPWIRAGSELGCQCCPECARTHQKTSRHLGPAPSALPPPRISTALHHEQAVRFTPSSHHLYLWSILALTLPQFGRQDARSGAGGGSILEFVWLSASFSAFGELGSLQSIPDITTADTQTHVPPNHQF